MMDKERMELLNLRKRVAAQREEIKRLRAEIEDLSMEKAIAETIVKCYETGIIPMEKGDRDT